MTAQIKNTEKFDNLAVLFGGNSAERDISLQSGQAVLSALTDAGIAAQGIDIQFNDQLVKQLEEVDRAFIALHGRGGEDGTIQAVLNLLKIPYTGSGVMASAIAMDKLRSKQIWKAMGLPTPEFALAKSEKDLGGLLAKMAGVAMVKPVREGSSIGMSRVTNDAELQQAFNTANQYDDVVLIERWIQGREFTCSVLANEALPVIQLKTPHLFYDFNAKYQANDTEYLCPCGLSSDQEKKLQQLSVQAFNALGCKGWGRVDLMQDAQGEFWLLEVNTVPGMTDHSLVPMAAKHSGRSFALLIEEILATAEYEALS